jgi:hypothetical protein
MTRLKLVMKIIVIKLNLKLQIKLVSKLKLMMKIMMIKLKLKLQIKLMTKLELAMKIMMFYLVIFKTLTIGPRLSWIIF